MIRWVCCNRNAASLSGNRPDVGSWSRMADGGSVRLLRMKEDAAHRQAETWTCVAAGGSSPETRQCWLVKLICAAAWSSLSSARTIPRMRQRLRKGKR